MIIKYHTPTKWDTSPKGTVWQYVKDDHVIEYYVQISEDEENPQWRPLWHVLDIIHRDQYDDHEKVMELIRRYENIEK